MGWKKLLERNATSETGNLSFAGDGKVSVRVASIVNSQKVQRQVAGVRKIAADKTRQK